MIDEPLFVAVGQMLDGQPTEDVVPVLITLSARVLSDNANGDAALLETLLSRFFALLKQQAEDMQRRDRQ
jgi:hypothetical protein